MTVHAILLAILAATMAVAGQALTSPPTAAPTDLYTKVYTFRDQRAFACPHYIYKNYQMGKCADGSNPRSAGTTKLNTNSLRQNWRSVCGLKCLERNVFNRDVNNQCVGFVRTANDACQLFQCPNGNTTVTDMRRPPKRRGRSSYVPISVLMDPTCFEAVPTSSPTTAAPTRAPTVSRCDVNGTYSKEFASLNGAPGGVDKFTEILPLLSLCEFVRPVSLNINNIKMVEDFSCTYDACLRWCNYDSGCTFSMWSPVDKVCYKANNLELTDHDTEFKPYWTGKYRVWKKSAAAIRYFSGKCNDLPPANCRDDPECEWNRGKKGYNDPLQGGGAGGYCGRIKCASSRNWSG